MPESVAAGSEAQAPASPGSSAPAAPVSATPPAPAAPVPVAPPPAEAVPTKAVEPKPAEPVKAESAKAEVKVELISKADQLKLPEKINEAESEFLKGKLETTAKSLIENKMPLAEAQKVFENQLQNFREIAAYGDARLKAMADAWDKQILSDAKLGGENLNRTSQLAERALTTLFGKDFYEKELKGLYLIHNPEVIKGLVKFAENAGDAALVSLGDKPTPPPSPAQTIGQKVYSGKDGKPYDPMNPGPQTLKRY